MRRASSDGGERAPGGEGNGGREVAGFSAEGSNGAKSVAGGINAWSEEIDSDVPHY